MSQENTPPKKNKNPNQNGGYFVVTTPERTKEGVLTGNFKAHIGALKLIFIKIKCNFKNKT